jgi:hypothetical protein
MIGLMTTTNTWAAVGLAVTALLFAACVAIVWAEFGGRRSPAAAEPGAEPTADDQPPWEQPGSVRRDCEPHRGTMLLWLGRLSLWLIAMMCVVGAVGGLGAIGLAVAVLVMASRDGAKMRAGTMDPEGDGPTRKGARYAVAALILSALVLMVGGCLLYVNMTADGPF